mmetsp:Transcript_11966/g.19826  ORF Transcript_11966/g.19826 Transcript_11966/m.19826 type:complete len:122 (-) Transcript_11966:54-419(-)
MGMGEEAEGIQKWLQGVHHEGHQMLCPSLPKSFQPAPASTEDPSCKGQGLSREFWQTVKTYSGRGGGQRRKAAPPADDLAKYFATKMSLPGEEGKEVPPPGAGAARVTKATGLQNHPRWSL